MQVRTLCVLHCTNTSGSRQVNSTAHQEAVEPELPRSGSEERAAFGGRVGCMLMLPQQLQHSEWQVSWALERERIVTRDVPSRGGTHVNKAP
jgi:hypothetical protein